MSPFPVPFSSHAHGVAKQIKTTLKVGEKDVNNLHPITVRSITIEAYKPKR